MFALLLTLKTLECYNLKKALIAPGYWLNGELTVCCIVQSIKFKLVGYGCTKSAIKRSAMHLYYSDISDPLARELQMAFILQATKSLEDGAPGRKEQLKDAV